MTMKVMLVTGLQTDPNLVKQSLQDAGYEVILATHQDDVFQHATDYKPYAILLEYEKEVGFPLLQQIRADPLLQQTIVIVFGEQLEPGAARLAMDAGADDALQSAAWDALQPALEARIARYASVRSTLTRRMEELDLLRQIDEELSYYMSPDWVISIMIDWALRRTSARAALMLLRDMRDNQLRLRHINGQWKGKQFGQGDMLDHTTFVDAIMESQKSKLIDDLRTQSEFVAVGEEMICMLGIPLIAGQNPLGILLLESDREKAFSTEDQAFLEQMANRAAVALEYSNLFERLINQMQAEIELREMFGRFISPEVAGAIQRGELNLSGEMRLVSVLFVDIRDFTSFCDTHAPEEVVELLNAFLPEIVKAAGQHGGIVNKFGGDSALVIFGAPNIVQDSAYQATQVAIKISAAMERISDERVRQHKLPVRVGIGISSGEVIAGAVGPRERQEYTVIGDAVNLAARLQGLTKIYPQYNIFITETTFEMLDQHRDKFQLATLGGIAIAGKAELVAVWSVMGTHPPM